MGTPLEFALIDADRIEHIIIVDESRPDWPDTLASIGAAHEEVVPLFMLTSTIDGVSPGRHWKRESSGSFIPPEPGFGGIPLPDEDN